MKMRATSIASVLASWFFGGAAAIAQPAWDTFSDTWVATDGLGRALPTALDVGAPRQDHFVGIFYFLWLGQHGDAGPYDITKILAADPDAMSKTDSPLWGAMQAPHHWGESLFGYYVSDDESVLAKHAQMLTDAGVDAVIFDVTNQFTYPRSWQALCRVWDRIRRRGGRTPQIIFLCPFGSPKKVVAELYDQLYGPGLYSDLWFRWAGKPLILADPAQLTELFRDDSRHHGAIQNFFTFRRPQPSYFVGPEGTNNWGWLEVYPQHAFTNAAGRVEEVTVGVAQNALDGKLSVLSNPRALGRSFHDGREPAPEGQDFAGRNFTEQWQHAFALDPQFVFVTGWNEWIAGRFQKPTPFYGDDTVTFVDEFNRESSRDCEPMRGGHGDAFYWQLVANIRRFKGVRSVPPVHSGRIAVDGKFADWAAVTPEFRDDLGDPVHRDHAGWAKGSRYVNHTGRNDIAVAKVSADAMNIYFYVRTSEPLSPPTNPNWMLLFIDADHNSQTGWLGYDFVVNRSNVRTNLTVLERNDGGAYRWKSVVDIVCRSAGNELEIAIPRTALGLTAEDFTLDFKWADNIQQTGDWSDFTLNGDAAPNARFNYRAIFRGENSKPAPPP